MDSDSVEFESETENITTEDRAYEFEARTENAPITEEGGYELEFEAEAENVPTPEGEYELEYEAGTEEDNYELEHEAGTEDVPISEEGDYELEHEAEAKVVHPTEAGGYELDHGAETENVPISEEGGYELDHGAETENVPISEEGGYELDHGAETENVPISEEGEYELEYEAVTENVPTTEEGDYELVEQDVRSENIPTTEERDYELEHEIVTENVPTTKEHDYELVENEIISENDPTTEERDYELEHEIVTENVQTTEEDNYELVEHEVVTENVATAEVGGYESEFEGFDGSETMKKKVVQHEEESDFEGFDDDELTVKKKPQQAQEEESDFEGFEDEKAKRIGGHDKGDESEFEGFDKDPADGGNMNGLIADIFGESDEEEEFEGFAENEVDKEGQKEKDEITKMVDSEKAKVKDDSSSSDEGVNDEQRMPGDGSQLTNLSDFDAMMDRRRAMNRNNSRKRRRDGDLINDSDDRIMEIIGRMKEAAEEDRELVTLNQPATKKLKMLNQVIELLKKADLRAALIDCGILRGITEWLSPLPDKSLPCLPIRKALLISLLEFPSLHSEVLKDSGIGKAVMYLLKHPKENRKNKETATKLINDWSRPIFNLTSNYKNLTKEEREERDYANLPKKRNIDSESAPKRDINKEMENEKKGLRPGDPDFMARARVPQPSVKDYVVRPKWNTDRSNAENNAGDGDGEDEAIEAPSRRSRGSGSASNSKKEPSRFEKHMRNIKNKNQESKKIARAVSISLEGRKMAL